MSHKPPEHPGDLIRIRTWFGLTAVIGVGEGKLHKAGLGRFVLPHPPLINWLLRWGMDENSRRNLSLVHELGHLQTLPFSLIYTIFFFETAALMGNFTIINIVILLLSAHAAWEIMAEIFTISRNGLLYKTCYQKRALWPRIIFWTLMPALTVSGWVIALM